MSNAEHPARLKFRPRASADSPGRALLLLAHPTLHRSRANARLLRAAKELPGVLVHDLYDNYPDFDIDIPHEQALLAAHDLIVLQFPMYWYSTPALLKQWQDLVLEFGWAYGPGGVALVGKRVMCAVTTGGPPEAYHPEGFNRFTVPELLRPLEQTTHLCGMRWLEPFVVQGVNRLDKVDLEQAAAAYAARLRALLPLETP